MSDSDSGSSSPESKRRRNIEQNNRDRLIRQLATLTDPPGRTSEEFDSLIVLEEAVTRLRRWKQRAREIQLEEKVTSSSSPTSNISPSDVQDAVLDLLDGFIFVVNERGIIVTVNETVTENTRYTQDELLGQSVYSFLHPDDHHAFMRNYMDLYAKLKANPKDSDKIRTKIHCRFNKKNAPNQYQLMDILCGTIPEQEPGTITCIGFPLPRVGDVNEVPDYQQFITKLDMNCTILDLKICDNMRDSHTDTINNSIIGKNFRTLIDPDDEAIFNHLFELAKSTGRSTGVPIYLVLQNSEIVEFFTEFRYFPARPNGQEPTDFMLAINNVTA